MWSTGCKHSCHSCDSDAVKVREKVMRIFVHTHHPLCACAFDRTSLTTTTCTCTSLETEERTYWEPSLEAVEFLATHVAAVAHHPFRGLLDERGRCHLRLGDKEPLPLQLSKHVMDGFVSRSVPKGSFPLSYQLQSLVDGSVTAAILQ